MLCLVKYLSNASLPQVALLELKLTVTDNNSWFLPQVELTVTDYNSWFFRVVQSKTQRKGKINLGQINHIKVFLKTGTKVN